MWCCAVFNKYACLFSSSPFLYSYPCHISPCQTIGLTQDYWGGHKAGRRRWTLPQAHQGCPWTGCREVWSMPTTFINISSRDLNIMVYRKANLCFFLPWRPVAVDKFCVKQTSFTDDCIQSKTLWSISIMALLCKMWNFSTEYAVLQYKDFIAVGLVWTI